MYPSSAWYALPKRCLRFSFAIWETACASVFLTGKARVILVSSVPPFSLLLCEDGRVNSPGLSGPEWGKLPHKWSIVLVTDLALSGSSVFDFLHLVSHVLSLWRYLWASAAGCLPPGAVAWVLTRQEHAELRWEATFPWRAPPAIRNERNVSKYDPHAELVLNRTFIEEVSQEAAGTLIPEAVGGSLLLAQPEPVNCWAAVLRRECRSPAPGHLPRAPLCVGMGALLRKAVGTLWDQAEGVPSRVQVGLWDSKPCLATSGECEQPQVWGARQSLPWRFRNGGPYLVEV